MAKVTEAQIREFIADKNISAKEARKMNLSREKAATLSALLAGGFITEDNCVNQILNNPAQSNSSVIKTAAAGGLIGLGVRSGIKHLTYKFKPRSNFWGYRYGSKSLLSKFVSKYVYKPDVSHITNRKNATSAIVFTLLGMAGGLLAGATRNNKE